MTNTEIAFFNGFFKQAAQHGIDEKLATELYYKYASPVTGNINVVGSPGSPDERFQEFIGANRGSVPVSSGSLGTSAPVNTGTARAVAQPAPQMKSTAGAGKLPPPSHAVPAGPGAFSAGVNNLKSMLFGQPAPGHNAVATGENTPIGANIR